LIVAIKLIKFKKMLKELSEVQSRKAGKMEKMSLKNIKDVLSRDEMKEIMAGYIGCTIFLASGSTAFSYSGYCSAGSLLACSANAQYQCQQYLLWGYSGCATQCG
jgi:hypothetical protein